MHHKNFNSFTLPSPFCCSNIAIIDINIVPHEGKLLAFIYVYSTNNAAKSWLKAYVYCYTVFMCD